MLIYNYVYSCSETIKLTFVSQFFSNFLPGGVAGDFYKINFLRKNQLDIRSGIAKIGIDRFSGVVVLFIFSGIYFLFNYNLFSENLNIKVNNINLFLFFLFMILIMIVLLISKLKNKIITTYQTIKVDFLKISIKNIYGFVALSIIVFLIRLVKFQVIFLALNVDFNFFDLIWLSFVSQIAGMLPISVGGLGVVEASLVYGLKLFDVSEQIAFAFALLNRATIWIVSIVGGMIWIQQKAKK